MNKIFDNYLFLCISKKLLKQQQISNLHNVESNLNNVNIRYNPETNLIEVSNNGVWFEYVGVSTQQPVVVEHIKSTTVGLGNNQYLYEQYKGDELITTSTFTEAQAQNLISFNFVGIQYYSGSADGYIKALKDIYYSLTLDMSAKTLLKAGNTIAINCNTGFDYYFCDANE